MKLNIDLAEKWEGPVSCCGSDKPNDVHYPHLHISNDEKIEVPEEGTMVVRYKKVGYSEHGSGGKTRYTCDFEIREIVSADGKAEPEAPSKRDKSAEEALDALVAERMKKKDY